ncbi:Tetratricopeptide repeat protein 14 [Kappamyces sp. JEL0680]|nr:Tetratricopeptide repeat protein 14 [Kappamyces sp. JEL0680]
MAVADGIELAKTNDFQGAMKKYNAAIELDSNCVEAYVSRGCLYANNDKTRLAIADLELALTLDPHHQNAQAYLDKIKKKRREEKKRKKDTVSALSKGDFVLDANFNPSKHY